MAIRNFDTGKISTELSHHGFRRAGDYGCVITEQDAADSTSTHRCSKTSPSFSKANPTASPKA